MKIKQGKDTMFLTKAVPASSNANSLRSTIPMPIVKMLGLTENDALSWDMKVVDGKLKVIVKKV